jgi:hypothetical protein
MWNYILLQLTILSILSPMENFPQEVYFLLVLYVILYSPL